MRASKEEKGRERVRLEFKMNMRPEKFERAAKESADRMRN